MNVTRTNTLNLSIYESMASGFCRSHAAAAPAVVIKLATCPWLATPAAIRQSRHCLDSLPRCGSLPAPEMEHCGAPAGKGLTKDPEGFPKGSIRTAGGYTVVPQPNQFRVYGPGQKFSENPLTQVWGDPHVYEKDGGKWDFTKSSDFRLPDGTLIYAKTTSETGASVTKNLTIVNGNDRVQALGLDTAQVKVGDVSGDGYDWRSEHVAENRSRDTYVLGGSSKDVRWYKSNNGRIAGEVTGSQMKDNAYSQTVDGTKPYFVAPELRPAVGSDAWGNGLRAQLGEQVGRWAPEETREGLTRFLSNDPGVSDRMPFPGWFGGTGHTFPSLGSVWSAVQALAHEILAHHAMRGGLSHQLSV